MSTITQDEYSKELRAFIVSQMSTITSDENHSLTFWAEFNNKCQAEFDASLTAQGITVE